MVETVATNVSSAKRGDKGLLAVVRIRGSMQTRFDVEKTLKQLHLNRKHNCTVLLSTPFLKGMLQKARDYIAWGEVDEKTLQMLLEKRAEGVDGKSVKDALHKAGVEGVEGAVKALVSGGKSLKQLHLKQLFKLQPPKGGFKNGIKTAFPKGILGDNGVEVNSLIQRMV